MEEVVSDSGGREREIDSILSLPFFSFRGCFPCYARRRSSADAIDLASWKRRGERERGHHKADGHQKRNHRSSTKGGGKTERKTDARALPTCFRRYWGTAVSMVCERSGVEREQESKKRARARGPWGGGESEKRKSKNAEEEGEGARLFFRCEHRRAKNRKHCFGIDRQIEKTRFSSSSPGPPVPRSLLWSNGEPPWAQAAGPPRRRRRRWRRRRRRRRLQRGHGVFRRRPRPAGARRGLRCPPPAAPRLGGRRA